MGHQLRKIHVWVSLLWVGAAVPVAGGTDANAALMLRPSDCEAIFSESLPALCRTEIVNYVAQRIREMWQIGQSLNVGGCALGALDPQVLEQWCEEQQYLGRLSSTWVEVINVEERSIGELLSWVRELLFRPFGHRHSDSVLLYALCLLERLAQVQATGALPAPYPLSHYSLRRYLVAVLWISCVMLEDSCEDDYHICLITGKIRSRAMRAMGSLSLSAEEFSQLCMSVFRELDFQAMVHVEEFECVVQRARKWVTSEQPWRGRLRHCS